MADTLDDRLLTITIISGSNAKTYSGLYIVATGTRYANELQNECEIRIANLNEETRNDILTNATPFINPTERKVAIVSAGRKSYGLTQIFTGNIVSADVTQPPDVTIVIRCLTGNFLKGMLIESSQPPVSTLRRIADQVSRELGVGLTFEADDISVANYTYSGPVLKQLANMNTMGEVDVYLDNNTLFVKNRAIPLLNRLRKVSASTGMVGIPQQTEVGASVTFMLDNYTTLGGAMEIESKVNPSLNGRYVIYQLGFEIANRERPFYWKAEGARIES